MRARSIIYIFILSFALPLLSAEPSIFGVPEKEKKEQEAFRQKVQKELYDLSVTIKKLRETQNGMQSLFDSQSKKVQELYLKNQRSPFATQAELQKSLKDLNSTLITNFRTYDESFESLKQGLESLGGLIEHLNRSQKQDTDELFARLEALEENFQKEKEDLVRELNTFKNNSTKQDKNKTDVDSKKDKKDKQESSESKKNITPPDDQKAIKPETNQTNTDDKKNKNIVTTTKTENKTDEKKDQEIKLESLSNSVIHKNGLDFFKKGDLAQSKRYLEYNVEKGYKPATSMYYLGEIAYKQKRFEDAIGFYKESATRYDKATYIPSLLLHTAVSFRELGDKDNAKNFLDILIGSYPNSKEAKEAKRVLKALK